MSELTEMALNNRQLNIAKERAEKSLDIATLALQESKELLNRVPPNIKDALIAINYALVRITARTQEVSRQIKTKDISPISAPVETPKKTETKKKLLTRKKSAQGLF